MRVPRLLLAALALTSGIILSGCAYDMYGDGYGGGYGYGPYSGVSVGIGYGGGYGGYGYGYPYGGYGYGGYGYGGYDPFGWYGDFYYPGSGIYVYDRYRHRHAWNDDQRHHWTDRRNRWQARNNGTTSTENWSGWDRSRSQYRNRNNATSVTTTTSTSNNNGTWRRGSGNNDRSNWQCRSSVTTRGQRSSEGGHRSQERSDERPN